MMRTSELSFLETFIRYASYPLIVGATAALLFGGLAAGWPYFPAVPITVGAALACVALLERRLPFHAAATACAMRSMRGSTSPCS
jgi:hypothetical protein